ncbi:MAG: glycosyltransferase family 4 protein [Bacteroidales bacterium]|nr:glycosyltransferase family 4 protein [Bacteroidales bacterium]
MSGTKVYTDGRTLSHNKTGISNYLKEVINNSEKKFHLISPKKIDNPEGGNNLSYTCLRFPFRNHKQEFFWLDKILPTYLKLSGAKIMWGPRYYASKNISCKKVVTIHDLAYKIIDGVVRDEIKDYYHQMVTDCAKHVDHFITVSETTKNDLCEHYQISPDRVTSIYNGYSSYYDIPPTETEVKQTLEKYKLDSDFILFLGTLEPRKNLTRLIKAYNQSNLAKNNVKLCIAGGKGWDYSEIVSEIEKANKEQTNIVRTGFVDDLSLKVLYYKCLYFTMPSLYEGFGIPILEGMACGAPVLTSNNSAMKEVFSESAYLVDPYSTESIADGLEKMCDDTIRLDFKEKGKKIYQQFSWKKTSKKHDSLFNSLA